MTTPMAANAWKCERCGAVTTNGIADEGPDGWRLLDVGVRGSADITNRTGERVTKFICNACDDALYEWFYGDRSQP